jgi:putative N-acetylmannosamine-6-phosphate epimerase
MMMSLEVLDRALAGGLIVSCQPVPGPLDDDAIVARLAAAAVAGGARGVRVEGAARVALVRQSVRVPIVGIVKRDLPDSPVRISPWLQDIDDLASAGAHIVAVDATMRDRPVPVEQLLTRIREHGCIAMADCSNLQDALAAHRLGFDLIGTTLSGYTGGAVPKDPDLTFLSALRGQVPRVVAEGRYNTPALAQLAMQRGAWAVTVGSAITRVETVTGWFADAISAAVPPEATLASPQTHPA